MIIRNLYVPGVAVSPNKAKAPLIIDSDAMLAFPVTAQCLQAVTRWRGQVAQSFGRVQLTESPERRSLNALEAFDGLSVIKPFRLA